MRFLILFTLFVAATLPASISPPPLETVIKPEPRVQTEPVPSPGDAADDPAIWVHPTNPAKSLILGTDKKGGLHVYDLAGKDLQTISDTSHPNNVDVLYDFPLSGKTIDLALAATRAPDQLGFKIWRIDPDSLRLTDITANNIIPTFNHTEPYGSCVYHSRKTGLSYFFVNNKKGDIEQYLLKEDGHDRITAEKVRTLKCNSITEGCVADDELAFLYIAEENVGIWKFPAEPDAPTAGSLITKVGDHGMTSNIEGLTLYCAAGGKGYLIASSQGSSTFKLYDRAGDNPFILTINPIPSKDGKIGDVSDTDGITVSNLPAGPLFPQGLLIIQDGDNTPNHQNFKLYAWQDIATPAKLLIDTTWSPRIRPKR